MPTKEESNAPTAKQTPMTKHWGDEVKRRAMAYPYVSAQKSDPPKPAKPIEPTAPPVHHGQITGIG